MALQYSTHVGYVYSNSNSNLYWLERAAAPQKGDSPYHGGPQCCVSDGDYAVVYTRWGLSGFLVIVKFTAKGLAIFRLCCVGLVMFYERFASQLGLQDVLHFVSIKAVKLYALWKPYQPFHLKASMLFVVAKAMIFARWLRILFLSSSIK